MNINLNKVPDGNKEPFIGQTLRREEEAHIFLKTMLSDMVLQSIKINKKIKNIRCNFSYHQGRKRPTNVIDTSRY